MHDRSMVIRMNDSLNMIHPQNSSSLFYNRKGHGKKILLLFHGFGQDHTAFHPLIESLMDDYVFYSFDLYFHGQSTWAKGDLPLEKQEWKNTIGSFLTDNAITEFSVLGFSLGAKFALATLEAFPEKTKAIFLVAPDGIQTSFWYTLATYPILFRKLFKSMILHPDRFFSVARMINAFGLLDKSVLRFAEHQMNTVEKRSRVYFSWVTFRHLSFEMKTIARLIEKFDISTTILVGRYDKVIPPEKMNRLLLYLKHYKLEVAEAGHNQLLNNKMLESFLLSATRNDNQR